MIKYHPTFVGWFIFNDLIEKDEDKFVVKKDRSIKDYFLEKPGKPISVDDNGLKRINRGYDRRFFIITPLNNYRELIKNGIDIYKDSCSQKTCHSSQLEEILTNHSDIVYDVYIPNDFPRLKGKARDNYINMHYRALDLAKRNNLEFPKYCSYRYGTKGDLKKHGIFAIDSIYLHIDWDFDMVEKYKDQIIWSLLLNRSNLTWNMEMVEKYEKYIQFSNQDAKTYCKKFSVGPNYEIFDFLSNDFLEKHKHEIDWIEVFEKCKFKWSADEMTYFCQYALSIDMPYSESFMNTSASSQIAYSLEKLLDNDNFQWNTNNLLAFLLLRKDNWKALVKKHRQNIFSLFMKIPNINKIAEPYVKDINNFWQIIRNESGYLYDDLTPEFTVENIKKKNKEWSKVIKEEYSSTYRIGKEYYSYYSIVTQWNIFMKRKNVPLTYEMAKYLLGINLIIGGGYEEDDGYSIINEHRFLKINGLDAFSDHHFASIKDLEKCVANKRILDKILSQNHRVNVDVVKYITDNFFKFYSIKDYIEIVNNLKDWDIINQFHGEGDDLWLNTKPK